MDEECIFCKISKNEVENEKICENENFFSIFDISPSLEGHALVISKEHFDTFFEMPENLGEDFLKCIKKTCLILKEKYNAEGFNFIANVEHVAGQIINHFHLHILPRKKSDNAILKFVDKDTLKSVELKDKKS